MRTIALYWFGLGVIGMILTYKIYKIQIPGYKPPLGIVPSVVAGSIFGPLAFAYFIVYLFDPVFLGIWIKSHTVTERARIRGYILGCLVLATTAWLFVIQPLITHGW
jgi:hypothetical protein